MVVTYGEIPIATYLRLIGYRPRPTLKFTVLAVAAGACFGFAGGVAVGAWAS